MRIGVAKDTISARTKLETEIEESTSNAIDYGTASHTLTCPRDEMRSAMFSFFSRPTDLHDESVASPSTLMRIAPTLENCVNIDGSPQSTFVPGVAELALARDVFSRRFQPESSLSPLPT